jgi:hypothetical protein
MEPRTVAAIGNLASGFKRNRLAPPRKAKKGGTKKGGTKEGAKKKGAKYVVRKKEIHPMWITQCGSPNVDHPM